MENVEVKLVPYKELFNNIQNEDWCFLKKESIERLKNKGVIIELQIVLDNVKVIYFKDWNMMVESSLKSDWYKIFKINSKRYQYLVPNNPQSIKFFEIE